MPLTAGSALEVAMVAAAAAATRAPSDDVADGHMRAGVSGIREEEREVTRREEAESDFGR